jgi:hexosaminidase
MTRYNQLIAPTSSSSVFNALPGCTVNVETLLAPGPELLSLRMQANETYSLSVTTSPAACRIWAPTVWGALRAMETFSQLLTRNTSSGVVSLSYAPVNVHDGPRFTHRGLLIDSSRHYLPLDTIRSVLDAMAVTKFNVLHWHLVDAQSFPYDSPSNPTLVKGAYAPSMRYSSADLGVITQFAADRGIQVIIEVDVPGHSASWLAGRPDLIPAGCPKRYDYNINNWALNPALESTYTAIASLLGDIQAATGTLFFHLGGDEVVLGCWKNDSSISAFMQSQGISTYEALFAYFIQRVDDITVKLGMHPMHWEEVFLAGVPTPDDTIFTVWTNSTRIAQLAAAKKVVVAAPSDYWYLDHPTSTWDVMWKYDPTVNLTEPDISFVVGGEAALWGEFVDAANIQSRLWPTAAAVAERLWSQAIVSAEGPVPVDPVFQDAKARMQILRCRFLSRHVPASPIGPGFCDPSFSYI